MKNKNEILVNLELIAQIYNTLNTINIVGLENQSKMVNVGKALSTILNPKQEGDDNGDNE